MLSGERRLYFGGDTAYFAGFKEAGQRLGPFDVAAIAIGACLRPEIMKAVQAFLDLDARVLLGTHRGTFDLSEEPPARMLTEISRRGIDSERAWILKLGETRRW